MIKNKTLKIILIVIGVIATVIGFVWLLMELFPLLLTIIIFPSWLIAALSEGGKV